MTSGVHQLNQRMAGVATDPIMDITAIRPRRSVEVSFIQGGGQAVKGISSPL